MRRLLAPTFAGWVQADAVRDRAGLTDFSSSCTENRFTRSKQQKRSEKARNPLSRGPSDLKFGTNLQCNTLRTCAKFGVGGPTARGPPGGSKMAIFFKRDFDGFPVPGGQIRGHITGSAATRPIT